MAATTQVRLLVRSLVTFGYERLKVWDGPDGAERTNVYLYIWFDTEHFWAMPQSASQIVTNGGGFGSAGHWFEEARLCKTSQFLMGHCYGGTPN